MNSTLNIGTLIADIQKECLQNQAETRAIYMSVVLQGFDQSFNVDPTQNQTSSWVSSGSFFYLLLNVQDPTIMRLSFNTIAAGTCSVQLVFGNNLTNCDVRGHSGILSESISTIALSLGLVAGKLPSKISQQYSPIRFYLLENYTEDAFFSSQSIFAFCQFSSNNFLIRNCCAPPSSYFQVDSPPSLFPMTTCTNHEKPSLLQFFCLGLVAASLLLGPSFLLLRASNFISLPATLEDFLELDTVAPIFFRFGLFSIVIIA